MTERDLVRALDAMREQPPTVDDWRDLYQTIEDYMRRRLARAIVASPNRAELVEAIRERAGA